MHPTLINFSNLQSLESRLITSAKPHVEQALCSQSSIKNFSYIKSLSSVPSVPLIVSLDASTGTNDCDKVFLFNSFFPLFQIPSLEELPVPDRTLSDISISELDVFEALSSGY